MGQPIKLGKTARKRVAADRKARLLASGHTYSDLARFANVSYSMADKWMNARRTSQECQRAHDVLTAQVATRVS